MTEPPVSHRPSAALCARFWWLALVLAVVAEGAPSWQYEFIDLDDARTIVQHELVTSLGRRPWLDYVRPERFGGLPEYMPLKTLSLAVDYAVFGASPRAFRGQQQLWYLLCALGVWIWARDFLFAVRSAGRATLSYSQIQYSAAGASLLFVLHPAHVESVTWLSGRKDVMCGAGMLAALVCALRWRPGQHAALAGACACSAFALLSKPVAVTLLLCFMAQDWVVQTGALRRRAPLYGIVAVLSALLLIVYLNVSLDGGQSIRPEAAERIYRGPTWFRMLQQLGLFARYALLPFGLSPELPTSLLGTLTTLHGTLWAALGALLLAAAGVGLWRRQAWAALLALFIAPLTPIVLRPAWAQYVAGRYLFLSIAPLALGVCWGAAVLMRQARRLRVPIALAVLAIMVAWGGERYAYDASYRNSFALWTQASAQFPDAPQLAQHAAQAAASSGRPQLAIQYYERCLALAPQHPVCGAQLGTLLLDRDDARAEAQLQAALPNDETGLAHRSLAFLWAAHARAADGVALYRAWLAAHQVDAERMRPLIGLALANHDRELTHKALRKTVQVMVLERPAQPPPLELFERTARSLDEPELAKAARRAAQTCQRTDCFAHLIYGEAL
jgi:tetratricopeptide (TPR) repeat protein